MVSNQLRGRIAHHSRGVATMRALLFTLCVSLLPALVFAAEGESEIAPSLEPKITIHEDKDKTIYEYSVNGFVYAIKVVPKNAPTYYLVKANKNGDFLRTDQPGDMLIPSWKVITW
jgi:hypothetical protein